MGSTVLVASFFALSLFSTVNAQNETVEATLTQTYIYSPGYADGAYFENLTYDYRVSTTITNHTVLLTVTDCDIEIFKGVCVKDFVTIYDGYNTSSPTLVAEFCCQVANPTYQSTGDTMYIVFTTDESVQLRGFAMSVQSDGPTTSTSTTTTTTVSNRGSSKRDYTWIIVGCCIGGFNLIIIMVIIIVCFLKKPKTATFPGDDHVTKWNGENATIVEPVSKKEAPPVEVVETNIFTMDLPEANGKANQLPPLDQSLEPVENDEISAVK